MTQTIRLYLDENGMSAWEMRNGRPERIADFPETPAGFDEFSRYLENADNRRFLLLINRHEERYLGEAMPALPRRERQQLAETRSRRAFPDTPWRCVAMNKGRREENTAISLMAVVNSSAIDTWTQRLNRTALAGIYTLPLLLRPLLGNTAEKSPRIVVLTTHRRHYRLTLLEHGLPNAVQWVENDDHAAIEDAWRRLLMHGNATDTPATLCLIGPREWRPQAPADITVNHLPTNEDAAQLILSLADRHWPRQQFAPPPARAVARHRQFGKWCWRTGALLLGAGVSLSAACLIELDALRRQTALERQHLAHTRQALAATLTDVSRSGLSPEQLRQFAQEHRQLSQQRSAFANDLVTLSRVLDRQPAIELDQIDWRIPSTQALTDARAELRLDGRVRASNSEQAGVLLQDLPQNDDRHFRLVVQPQPDGAGEFRFSIQLRGTTPT